jgi:hypothetical protein
VVLLGKAIPLSHPLQAPDLAVTALVHPINTSEHPHNSPGWRWAVMVGNGQHSDLGRCANAGWASDEDKAKWAGDTCAATAVRTANLLGLFVRYQGIVVLDHDPVPATANQLNVI